PGPSVQPVATGVVGSAEEAPEDEQHAHDDGRRDHRVVGRGVPVRAERVHPHAATMVPRMETLQVAQGGGVTTVTLARPERKNAINDVMWRELREVLEGIAADPSVRCVVLTGAGGAFCSGA